MEVNAPKSTKLSNLQIELLKLYSHDISDEELKDIKKMLADYFARRVDEDMDQLWKENKWDNNTIEDWKQEHLRVSSKK